MYIRRESWWTDPVTLRRTAPAARPAATISKSCEQEEPDDTIRREYISLLGLSNSSNHFYGFLITAKLSARGQNERDPEILCQN